MVASYTVGLKSPRCGKKHTVIGGIAGSLVIENGPDREGTIVELYEGQCASVLYGARCER